MSQLVTGQFYERADAMRAVEVLKASGIPAADIYLEEEINTHEEMMEPTDEVERAERERRFAGLETGMIIGLVLGMIAGGGTGLLFDGIGSTLDGEAARMIPAFLMQPMWCGVLGAAIGVIAGAIVGWMVDYTLTRMGAGPARPREETRVTVLASETATTPVFTALCRAHARHLHVADHSL